MTDIAKMIEQYAFTTLWASGEDDDGTRLDDDYDTGDFSAEATKQMEGDCEQFVQYAENLIEQLPDSYSEVDLGHDFLLTRNGHGAGFWDRGLGDLGDKLTEAAQTFGSQDVYAGDDGKLYLM